MIEHGCWRLSYVFNGTFWDCCISFCIYYVENFLNITVTNQGFGKFGSTLNLSQSNAGPPYVTTSTSLAKIGDFLCLRYFFYRYENLFSVSSIFRTWIAFFYLHIKVPRSTCWSQLTRRMSSPLHSLHFLCHIRYKDNTGDDSISRLFTAYGLFLLPLCAQKCPARMDKAAARYQGRLQFWARAWAGCQGQ